MDGYSAYREAKLAELYDAVYEGHDDAGFWSAIAAQAPDGPLLELGCGTGRILIPLARSGREVVGLDSSASMLERCRAKLVCEPPDVRQRVTLVAGDMTAFDLDGTFAAVVCAFNSFHHLRTAEDQLSCLNRCHDHLAPGGVLVLDLFNPDPAPQHIADEPDEGSPAVASPDGPVDTLPWTEGRYVRKWLSRCDYDRSLQCNECEVTYEVVEADGSTLRFSETFPLRLVYRYEIEHLLARCGFRIQALYGDYDRSPFAEDSLGMIVVAEPIGHEPLRSERSRTGR